MRRGGSVVAPSPQPLPRRVLKRTGAWKRLPQYLALALLALAGVWYLEVRSGRCAWRLASRGVEAVGVARSR
jgi:hypothetical protein